MTAPVYVLQDAADLLARLEILLDQYKRSGNLHAVEYECAAIIRALMERVKDQQETITVLNRDRELLEGKASTVPLQHADAYLELQARLESLEAEKDLVLQKIGLVDGEPQYPSWWPTPSQIAARVEQRRKERGG